jgi:hypothetical protein
MTTAGAQTVCAVQENEMKHLIGILVSPVHEWARIRDANASIAGHYLGFLIWKRGVSGLHDPLDGKDL